MSICAQAVGHTGEDADDYDHACDDDEDDDGTVIHNPHHHVCIMLSASAHRGDEAGVCCI